tara:strand:+ start:1016 stop:1192 length:177 start_codon:yes stop_codon:yes gene_type:complete
MPEESKRVVVKGLKKAEKEFQKYLRLRIGAEKTVAQLEEDLKEALAEVERQLEEERRG